MAFSTIHNCCIAYMDWLEPLRAVLQGWIKPHIANGCVFLIFRITAFWWRASYWGEESFYWFSGAMKVVKPCIFSKCKIRLQLIRVKLGIDLPVFGVNANVYANRERSQSLVHFTSMQLWGLLKGLDLWLQQVDGCGGKSGMCAFVCVLSSVETNPSSDCMHELHRHLG